MPSQLSDWILSPANQSPRMRAERVLHTHVWALRRSQAWDGHHKSHNRTRAVLRQTCMHAVVACRRQTDKTNRGKRPPSPPPTKPIVSYKDHKKHRRHRSEDPQPDEMTNPVTLVKTREFGEYRYLDALRKPKSPFSAALQGPLCRCYRVRTRLPYLTANLIQSSTRDLGKRLKNILFAALRTHGRC